MVSAFDWGSKGRRFESAHPDSRASGVVSNRHDVADPGRKSEIALVPRHAIDK